MQAAKKALESVKESAANIGASAKSGLEKTKATVQEKTEKMYAHDPIEKDMATHRKEERLNQAELEKQETLHHNSAVKESATTGHTVAGQHTATGPIGTRSSTNYTTGEHGQPMGANQMSKMPNQGLGYELGQSVMTDHMEGQHTATGTKSPTNYTTGGHGHGHSHGLGQSVVDDQMGSQYNSTGLGLGPGTETAAYTTTGEPMSPMRANHTSSMHGQHEHGLGHGLEELAEEMVGSHPTGRNTGMGRTKAHNSHVGGTASAPSDGPRFT
ncbi:hypothetical protein Lal_00017569 [Lupinus albus]|uniref:Putative Late embryogenesis abundant protein, LEA-25/LEA-D113 n=1 Tax=Lupinus albus TaxID=3870 RepID=A0A6A5MET2_LUPAL|nr:putative Late embryogenesis abundant protein, LEA-25/LEA-D113 [Lupinus albus]KAF1869990.1 hypothetical protein Lal_00017569 [Lupinus albus]